MSPRFDVTQQVTALALAQPDWPAHFIVFYGGLGPYAVFHFVVGLEHDPTQDVGVLKARLEACAPGEVVADVLGRTEWERGAIELDTRLLEAFQQGTVTHDNGEWANVYEHLQALADRGLIVKTRLGWRRPGDAPPDPDAEMMAQMFKALRKSRH